MTDKIQKKELINQVIQKIESAFTDSIVLWSGTGCPDEDFAETEQFEALWITVEDYDRFEDFVWDLEKSLAEPNGYSTMVHCLSPDATREYRWKEYQKERIKRHLKLYQSEWMYIKGIDLWETSQSNLPDEFGEKDHERAELFSCAA